jgi:VanZ family protein
MAKKILFFGYLVLITLLSLWPSDSLLDIKLFSYSDKLIHAGMYAGFTFLMFWAWPEDLSGPKQMLPLLIVIIWGFLMELLQRYSHLGRSFDLADVLANSLGFLPGWIGWKWFGRRHV